MRLSELKHQDKFVFVEKHPEYEADQLFNAGGDSWCAPVGSNFNYRDPNYKENDPEVILKPQANEVWRTVTGNLVILTQGPGNELMMFWFDKVDGKWSTSPVMNRLRNRERYPNGAPYTACNFFEIWLDTMQLAS